MVATCSLDVKADPPILGKYMMYCSFSYSHICIKSLLHYLFLIIYHCTLLSAIYCSILLVTPIFAWRSVISIYLIYDLNFHFKQYIPCFARTGVEGNLGLYFADDSQDVILTMQHGFTMTVSVKLDKDGHSYFNADLWRKMSKCYELKAGNKILVRAPQPGLINMDVYFPNVISRSKSDQG